MCVIACFIFISCCAVLLASANRSLADPCIQPAGNQNPILLKTIQKAWRERQEKMRSIKLVYVVNTVETPEATSRIRMLQALREERLGRSKISGNARPAAPEKQSYSIVCLFACKGNRLRYDYWRTKTNADARRLVADLGPGNNCEYAAIVDGDMSYSLEPQATDAAGTKYRRVSIFSGRNDIACQTTGSFLLRLYRGATPAFRTPLPAESTELTVVPRTGTQPAIVVASFEREELWLDPSRDYVVAKAVVHNSDGQHLTSETECEYEKAPAPLGWVPKKWTTSVWFSDGVLSRRDEHLLIESTSNENDVPETLFHFDYPNGTLILDWSDQHKNKYAIAWNGRQVAVDLGRPYNELLQIAKRGRQETHNAGK